MDWPFWPPSAAFLERSVDPETRIVGAVELAPASGLYQALCQPDSSGVCQFSSEVVLSVNLPCHGPECDVDTVRVVQVQTAAETVYYEYVPAPCVEYAFFANGKFARAAGTSRHQLQCFNPETAAAGTTCVNPEDLIDPDQPGSNRLIAREQCNYAREKVKYGTAAARCQATPRHRRGLWHAPGSPAAAELGIAHVTNPLDFRLQYYSEEVDTEFGMVAFPSGGKLACMGVNTEVANVQCCSDTQIRALDGDNPAQTYNRATGERRTTCLDAGLELPWAESVIVNFASANTDPEDDDGTAPSLNLSDSCVRSKFMR